MSEVYVVKSGETLAGIASKHGFQDWRAVYDHPANAKLRSARPDPALIHPGDKIFIPDKLQKSFSVATDVAHTVAVKAPPPKGETYLRSVTILVHGVNTDASWFKLVETEMKKYQDVILVGDDKVEHKLRYGVIPFSWGDYENKSQGGNPLYAVDEVRQMFQNSWVGYDRIYQGHSAVRLKELVDEARKLGVQVNVIAHSNGTALTCGALMLGIELDNVIFMGSPLDCDNTRSQNEIKRALSHVTGTTSNFWSRGDEWAWAKGGIGAYGSNAVYRKANPNILNVQFYKGAVIRGVKITEKEVDHSDYMIAPHMPIFSSYVRKFGESVTGANVVYDQAKVDALLELADWTKVSYYKDKKNVTLESPEMKKYESQIKAILE
jgi:hypothetical protein